MKRNNLTVFIIHVVVQILIAPIVFDGPTFLVLLLPFLYIVIGYFLKPQASLIKDFLSVSSITFALLIIWTYCFISAANAGPSGFLGPKFVWILYVVSNFFSSIAASIAALKFNTFNYLLTVISGFIMSFLPSLMFVIGLHIKKRRNRGVPL